MAFTEGLTVLFASVIVACIIALALKFFGVL